LDGKIVVNNLLTNFRQTLSLISWDSLRASQPGMPTVQSIIRHVSQVCCNELFGQVSQLSFIESLDHESQAYSNKCLTNCHRLPATNNSTKCRRLLAAIHSTRWCSISATNHSTKCSSSHANNWCSLAATNVILSVTKETFDQVIQLCCNDTLDMATHPCWNKSYENVLQCYLCESLEQVAQTCSNESNVEADCIKEWFNQVTQPWCNQSFDQLTQSFSNGSIG